MRGAVLIILICLSVIHSGAQCEIAGLSATYCLNSPPSSLNVGMPGATVTGAGVSNASFVPAAAGPGTHTLVSSFCNNAYTVTQVPFGINTNGTYTVELGDNELSKAIPIGFSFRFFCKAYTHFYFSSNGFITFSANQGSGCCQGLAMPTAQGALNAIAVCWTDLDPTFGGTVRHDLLGTAPNRTLMINYNCIFHHNNGAGGDPVTGYIFLHEGTNIIEIHTAIKPVPSVTINATAGIQDSSGTLAYTIPGRNGANWTAGYDAYRFTPGEACTSTATTSVIAPPLIIGWQRLSMCQGERNTLTAHGALTYTWDNGRTTFYNEITPSVTAVYSVTGTDGNGCSATASLQVKVSECAGIDEAVTGPPVVLFPNPASDRLQLSSPYAGVLAVSTMNGEILDRFALNGSSHSLDVSGYPSGVYLISFTSSAFHRTARLVIMR